MRLSPPPLDIADNEAFQRDIFQAKTAAERLARVVTELEGHSVIVLDGDWGSGKTTFTKQWAGLMRTQHNRPVVYLDAFQMDHHDNAFFVMLAHALATLMPDPDRGLFDLAIRTATKVLRAAPGAALTVALDRIVPYLTAGVLQGKDLVIKDDAPDDWIREQLKVIENESNAVARFQETLTKIVSESPHKAPFVFIIDELDRCKPTFALDVLERMKHVFSADGICFILVTHLEELAEMVKHAYGIRDAKRYLEKFYHLRITMDSILSTSGIEITSKYLQHLASTTVPVFFKYQGDTMIRELVAIHGLRLRDVERMAIGLALYERTADDPNHRHSTFLIVGLCILRVSNISLYRQAADGQMTFEDSCSFFRFDSWNNQVAAQKAKEVWNAGCVYGQEDREENSELAQHAVTKSAVLPDICRHIELFWNDMRSERSEDTRATDRRGKEN